MASRLLRPSLRFARDYSSTLYLRPSLSPIKRFNSTLNSAKTTSTSTTHDPTKDPQPILPDEQVTNYDPKSFHSELSSMLRVNHAGEVGANSIYLGQALIFQSDPKLSSLISHMWDQEKKHLAAFERILPQHQVRPSALLPLWSVAGFVLGAGTALMGKEAAMACTEAVETVIGKHYNDQIRRLVEVGFKDEHGLVDELKEFRDDELEHLNTAVKHDAGAAPSILNQVIQGGCKVAIEVAKRV